MKNTFIMGLFFSVNLVSASTFRISNEALVNPSIRKNTAKQFLDDFKEDFFSAVISKSACENDTETGGMLFDGAVRSRLWLLCYAGAKVNACTAQDKKAPLHRAVLADNEAAVATLLDWSANPNVRDVKGRTPYSIALKKGHKSITGLLKQRGALTDFHTCEMTEPASLSLPVSPK